MSTRALVLVDLQNDFMPGGALAVPRGHEVVPIANQLQASFDLVVATQDWHPPGHASFADAHPGHAAGEVLQLDGLDQILWPTHCVQETSGAALHQDLDLARVARVFHKGTDPTLDSYSAFFDNAHRRATGLGDYLAAEGVDEVFVLGLALDYCVKFSALDARHLGLQTSLVLDACRAVELQAGDGARAVEELRAAGVQIVQSAQLLTPR